MTGAGISMRLTAAVALVGMTLAGAAPRADAQQLADTSFRPRVAAPAYPDGTGPVVLLDEAHANFHTLDGRYSAFGRLLAADGYAVRANRERFTRSALDSARVLVIANALHAETAGYRALPAHSAFSDDEIAAVREWVRDGGALLLIADHMPFAGAAEQLAIAFGITFRNGFNADSAGRPGPVRFRRADGTLRAHPITDGRTAGERVDSVTSFTGQAFSLGAAGGEPLLALPAGSLVLLPEEAWRFSETTPRIAAGGMLHGAVLRFGRGRVAVFGEAAMFTAQVAGETRRRIGMNAPGAEQNAQLALNVLHWLSGLLDD